MSTSAEIGLSPMAFSRCCIHFGDGPFFTPLTMRKAKPGHRSGASIVTLTGHSPWPATGMIAAAFGYLTPVQGALLQEVIDVAVILNALRALRIAPHEPTTPKPKAVSSGQDDIAQGATP